MTEKRFECDKGSRIIIDNKTKLHYIMTLDWECSLVTKLLNRFAEENEQLKSTIKEVTELLSDEVDLFSDKATEHDINAYMELKELDNKDAFYMAQATKTVIKMLNLATNMVMRND